MRDVGRIKQLPVLRHYVFFFFVMSQDAVCSLMSRATTTTHVEEHESELELRRPDKKDEPAERSSERCRPLLAEQQSRRVVPCEENKGVFSRSWQAESVDSGCSNSTAFAGACSEGLCGEGLCLATGGRCEQGISKLSTIKVSAGADLEEASEAGCMKAPGLCGLQVEKATMTDGSFPEPLRVRHKERGGRWGHASPFMRGSTIVRSQTFSPGARSQYVCRVSYRQKNLMPF